MKGILMRPDMIQAIIEGRKTQTRRVIKPQPDLGLPEFERYSHISVGWYHPTKIDKNGEQYPGDEIFGAYTEDGEWGWRCPYQVGETVYIKEAFYYDESAELREDGLFYKADEWMRQAVEDAREKWTSPLFMPEWAAQHFLTITGVRAERLQEITDADCEAEGVKPASEGNARDWRDDENGWHRTFRQLWNSINPKYPWGSNPWVFAYTFRQEIPQTYHGPK